MLNSNKQAGAPQGRRHDVGHVADAVLAEHRGELVHGDRAAAVDIKGMKRLLHPVVPLFALLQPSMFCSNCDGGNHCESKRTDQI